MNASAQTAPTDATPEHIRIALFGGSPADPAAPMRQQLQMYRTLMASPELKARLPLMAQATVEAEIERLSRLLAESK